MNLAQRIGSEIKKVRKEASAKFVASGYTQVSKKLDNFVFKTDANFTYSVADKNRYVKFGDTVVDTYGPELVTNGDFSDGMTGWTSFTGQSTFLGKLIMPTGSTANRVFSADSILKLGKTYVLSFYCESKNTVGCEFSVENGSIIINSNNMKIGYNRVVFTSDNNSRLRIYSYEASGGTSIFDNISVREIQTADFSNDIPNVTEVITNGSNTTSVSVNAGDYVVDGSELVTDSFTINNVNRGSIVDNADSIDVINNGDENYPGATSTITGLVIGESYKVSTTINIGTSSLFDVRVYDGTTSIVREQGSVSTTVTAIFIATTESISLTLYNFEVGNTGSTLNFTRPSIKRVSDTFRAIQTAPIGTSLTDIAYFEDRTEIGVTNQVLSYHAYNTLTNAYEGIKTEVLFSDVSKIDLLNNDTLMASNGFSKASKHLYSKGVYYVLPVGIWQSLNKGAYHPFLNPFGTATMTDTAGRVLWYDTSVNPSSTAYCFSKVSVLSGNIADNNKGRQDSKFYDIVYPDQFTDVRQYAKIATPYEVDLIRKDKEENGVEEVVSMHSMFNKSGGGNAYNITAPNITIYTSSNIGSYDYTNVKHGDKFYVTDGLGNIVVGEYRGGLIASTDLQLLVIANHGMATGTVAQNGSIQTIYIVHKPILSSGTKLSIDLIGNPQFYPQIIKDRLASGIGIVGINPLLVEN